MDRPRTLRIENGPKAEPTYSPQEMSRRLERLRDYMVREGMDAALFTSFHNINYFTDFLYCAFGRSYGLVVTQDRSTTVSANIDGGQPWRQSFGDCLVYTDWQRDSYFYAIKELIPAAGRVGVELDHISVENYRKLSAALEPVELVDIGAPTMQMRLIKSDEEIALITDGARIADIGGWACIEAMGEGVPEFEVARHSTTTMVREIASAYPHTELMDTWTWFQSALNTDGAHNPLTTRRLERGDILSLNCFPMISGYYHALERTLLAERDLSRSRPPPVPHLRIRPLLRLAQPLLRPGSGSRASRGHRHRAGARHGGLHGAHDHVAGGRGRCRRLPGARHTRRYGERRNEHHEVPLRAGAQHHPEVIRTGVESDYGRR
jgi:creatinase